MIDNLIVDTVDHLSVYAQALYSLHYCWSIDWLRIIRAKLTACLPLITDCHFRISNYQ